MSKDYSNLLKQIEAIADENNLKDYPAFTYWFIETSFGFEKERILNSICDGAHDKGIDAVIIDYDALRYSLLPIPFWFKHGD